MAIELEDTIRREIGLGSHYNWYNGSGSCQEIRFNAVKLLPDAIKKHADAGEQITQPNPEVITILEDIARKHERSEYSLTKTWQAVSDVIWAHCSAFFDAPEKKVEKFVEMAQHLREQYCSSDDQQINS